MTPTQPPPISGSCCRKETPSSWNVLPICPTGNFRIRFDKNQTSGRAIPLEGALTWLKENLQQGAGIEALEIDGPGDPLATPELTFNMAAQIHREYPQIHLRIGTLGLHGAEYAKDLTRSGIKGATIFVDTVKQATAQKIYAWIRPAKSTVPLKQATEILINEQSLAIKAFKEAGIEVTIRTTVYPGYNDTEINLIAQTTAALGADCMTLVPYKPGTQDDDDFPGLAGKALMEQIRKQCAQHFTEVTIETQAAYDIGMSCTSLAGECNRNKAMLPKPSKERPNIAVVSSNGMEIDLHLGQAYQLLIYGPREDGLPCLLGTRLAPEPGGGGSRWAELAQSLPDCFALVTASAGETPRKILAEHGITVLISDGEIEGTADALLNEVKKCKK